MEKNDIIEHAVHAQHVVEFEYDGRHRVVEPHVFGRKDGRDQLLGYQFEGESATGGLPEWRRFEVERIRDLRETATPFPGPREAGTVRPGAWDETYATVK